MFSLFTLFSFYIYQTIEELWTEVIDNLNSNNNENVIAAYSILTNMVDEDQIPDNENPIKEITNALENIMNNVNDNTALDIITSNIALVDLLTSDPTLVNSSIALEISTQIQHVPFIIHLQKYGKLVDV